MNCNNRDCEAWNPDYQFNCGDDWIQESIEECVDAIPEEETE